MTAAVIRWLADDARAATEIETILDRREVERGRVELSGVAGLTRAEIEIGPHDRRCVPSSWPLPASTPSASGWSRACTGTRHRAGSPSTPTRHWSMPKGIDRLAERAGVGPAVSALTARAMRGELDYEASLRERTERLAGLPWSEVEAEAADLPLVPGAAEAVSTARDRGWHVAVISGGFLPLVEAVARRLRLDHATAHELEVIDGRLSGRICGPDDRCGRQGVDPRPAARRVGRRSRWATARTTPRCSHRPDWVWPSGRRPCSTPWPTSPCTGTTCAPRSPWPFRRRGTHVVTVMMVDEPRVRRNHSRTNWSTTSTPSRTGR